MTSSAFKQKRMSIKRKAPRTVVPQRLFTRIIMRAKVVCTLTHQLSLPHRRPSSRSSVRRRISRRPDPQLPHGAGNHRRRGSASTPSAASRREAFTRSGAGGSLGGGGAVKGRDCERDTSTEHLIE